MVRFKSDRKKAENVPITPGEEFTMIRTIVDFEAALKSYKGQAEVAKEANRGKSGRRVDIASGEIAAIEKALELLAEFQSNQPARTIDDVYDESERLGTGITRPSIGEGSRFRFRLETHKAGPSNLGIAGVNNSTIFHDRAAAETAYSLLDSDTTAELWQERCLKRN